MLQIASPIWNKIAPTAKHPVWQRLMAMDAEAMGNEMERQFLQMQAQGVDDLVALAYQELAPLLQERQAVQAFSAMNPQYREALPEVLSVNEAILLAVRDHHLKVSQTRELRKLLAEPPPMT